MKKKLICIPIFIFLIFSISFGIFFIGCADDNNGSLEAPKIFCENGVIKWEKVDNAEKYELVINNNIYQTYNNFYELTLSDNLQEFTIKARSIAGGSVSEYSQNLSFVAKKYAKIDKLNINIDYTKDEVNLVWSESNCDQYKVKINDSIYYTNNNKMVTNKSFYKEGKNQVSVEPYATIYDNVTPINKTIEKSKPLNNLFNIRIEDGQLKYGIDSVYDTAKISPGTDLQICLQNIEEGKIASEGPSISVSKLHAPLINYVEIGENKISVRVNGWFREDERDCDCINVEIYDESGNFINSGQITNFSGQINYFAGDIYFYHENITIGHVVITAKKDGCLDSTPILYNI